MTMHITKTISGVFAGLGFRVQSGLYAFRRDPTGLVILALAWNSGDECLFLVPSTLNLERKFTTFLAHLDLPSDTHACSEAGHW